LKATSPNSGYAVCYHSSKPFGYAQGFAYPQVGIGSIIWDMFPIKIATTKKT